ncbi:MAG: homocysteine S-methyltransferase family protein [Muribaculaceae bacterium]|nr:homocysteine S-methyltransferase family protein [Muribaculaceae bacterium]
MERKLHVLAAGSGSLPATADRMAYLDACVAAGANIVTADTLCLREPELIKRRVALARVAVDSRAEVAANIGPQSEVVEEYVDRVLAAVEGGAHYILFETFYEPVALCAALDAIKQLVPVTDLPPVMLSLSPVTGYASTFDRCLCIAAESPCLRAVGLNCFTEATEAISHLQRLHQLCDKPLIASPNAGFPDTYGMYPRTPSELAQVIRNIRKQVPLALAGACCGSGPEHIAALASLG